MERKVLIPGPSSVRPCPVSSAGGIKAPRSQRAAWIDLSRGMDRKRTLVSHSLAPASRRPIWVSGKPRPSLCPRPRPCGSGGMHPAPEEALLSLLSGCWHRGTLPAKAKGEAMRLLPQRLQRPLDLVGGRPHMPPGGGTRPRVPSAGGQGSGPASRRRYPRRSRGVAAASQTPHPSLGQNPLTPLFPGTAIPSTDP